MRQMVKTFQLHFSEEELEKIGKKAQELGMSKKAFIMKAIEEKLKEEK